MTAHQSELIRQHEAHIARRARLWEAKAAKPRPAAANQEQMVIRVIKPSPPPLWKEKTTHFDEHVKEWRWKLAEEQANRPKAYLRRRCAEYEIPFPVMIGLGRRREIVGKRQLIMWEIHREFGLSFPQIGRLFGGRDHTTALHAYRKIEAMTAEERNAL